MWLRLGGFHAEKQRWVTWISFRSSLGNSFIHDLFLFFFYPGNFIPVWFLLTDLTNGVRLNMLCSPEPRHSFLFFPPFNLRSRSASRLTRPVTSPLLYSTPRNSFLSQCRILTWPPRTIRMMQVYSACSAPTHAGANEAEGFRQACEMLQIPAGGWIYVWMRICMSTRAKQSGGFGCQQLKIALDLNARVISSPITESCLIPDQDTEEAFSGCRWYGIVIRITWITVEAVTKQGINGELRFIAVSFRVFSCPCPEAVSPSLLMLGHVFCTELFF